MADQARLWSSCRQENPVRRQAPGAMGKSSEVGEGVVDRRSVGGFARASPDFGRQEASPVLAMYRHVFASLGVWPNFASYAGVGIYDGHAHKK